MHVYKYVCMNVFCAFRVYMFVHLCVCIVSHCTCACQCITESNRG